MMWGGGNFLHHFKVLCSSANLSQLERHHTANLHCGKSLHNVYLSFPLLFKWSLRIYLFCQASCVPGCTDYRDISPSF